MTELGIQVGKLGESALKLIEDATPVAEAQRTVDGTVHSVFRRVVNFRSSDGRLFALTVPGVPCAPNSLIASSPLASERGWPDLGLIAGVPLRLTLGTGRAEVYRSFIHRLPAVVPPPDGWQGADVAAAKALATVTRLAAASPLLTDERFSAVARPYLTRLTELVRATAVGSPLETDEVARAAQGLLGLGPGLTPSGDDLLAGFMMAFAVACARRGQVELALEVVNPAIMREAPGATGELSLDFLRYAALGEGNELLDELVEALSAGDEGRSAAVGAKLAQVGATSGLDQLLGVSLGFRLGLSVRPHPSPA